MKNNLFLLGALLILNNCTNFEFVNKTNIDNYFLKNNTELIVDGDNASQIRIVLNEKIGGKKDNFPKYQLSVNSSKTEVAEVIKKDATASKFNIQYSINYDFYSLYKNCKLFSKKINTISSYNVKSAGYSFGTDLSQKESIAQNINKNINNFFSSLNAKSSVDSCEE